MCGGPQVHSEIKITLLIFKHTPNSNNSLRNPNLYSSFQVITPNSKTPLRIQKHHSEFENVTSNLKTSLWIRKHTPNLKSPLLIPKLHYEFENITLNWKTWLQIRKLHSQFSNSTPSSKTSLPVPNPKPRVLGLFFQRVEPEGGTRGGFVEMQHGIFSKFSRWRWQTHPASSGFSAKLTSSSHKTFHFSYMKFPDEIFIKVKVSSIFKEKNNSG